MEISINDLLLTVIKKDASDLHLLVGVPPIIRIDGNLIPLSDYGVLTPDVVEKLTFSVTTAEQKELIVVNKELDFSVPFKDEKGEEGRFRANVYYQKGSISSEFRYIPTTIRSVEELNLPKIMHEFTKLRQGFI